MGNTPEKSVEGTVTTAPQKEKNLIEEAIDKYLIAPSLEALLDKDKIEAKQIAIDYVREDGKIDMEALRKETDVSKKFAMMLWLFFKDKADKALGDKILGHKLKEEGFDNIRSNLGKKNSKWFKVIDGNIIHFSEDTDFSLFNLTKSIDELKGEFFKIHDVLTDKTENGTELTLPLGGTIVIDQGAIIGKSHNVVNGMRLLLERNGKSMKVFSAKEHIPDQSNDEVQLVVLSAKDFPSKDTPHFNLRMLEAAKKIYERGRAFFNDPLLIAGIYKLQGLSTEAAIHKSGLKLKDADFVKAALNEIGPAQPIAKADSAKTEPLAPISDSSPDTSEDDEEPEEEA